MADSPEAVPASAAPDPSTNPLKRLYRWILSWAHHPMGSWALAVFAFLDSFIFPIPPLFLQVALSIERPRRSFWYAAVNTTASVLGSIVGYGIGYLLFDSVGQWLVGAFGGREEFELAGRKLKEGAFVAILGYSFLPLPYKLITIASGVFHAFVPLPTLLLASTLGRSGRFLLLATLCFTLGPRAKTFIERYFNGVCLAIGALVVLGLLLFKVVLKPSPDPPPPAVDPSLRARVELSTGWTFKTEPVFERIDRRQLLARLEAKLDGKPGERMAANGRALGVLGLLPAGYDLVAGLKRVYTEEILALYDLQERKIFLVLEALEKPPSAQDLELRKLGRPSTRDATVAHEMVHALQHQHDPLLDLLEDLHPDFDDVRMALHALAEGEATLHQYGLLGVADPAPIVQGIEADGARRLPGEPGLLRRLLYLPYAAGTRFAGGRAQKGPALHASPPLSTEQVFHPERSAEKDPPFAVLFPDLSAEVGGGRTLAVEAVMGEAFLAPLLSGGPPSLSRGFEGEGLSWGGDRLHLYEKAGGTPVVVVVTRWDSPAAAAEARLRLGRKEGWAAVHIDLQVAFAVGLPAEEGRRLARLALDRAVAKPFRSVDELRALRPR